MAIIREPLRSKHFTQVPNHWLRDPRLTGKAKGYMSYIASHAPGYELTMRQFVAEMKEGADAIYAGLRELEEAGYLKRVRRRGERGRLGGIDYTVIEFPEGVDSSTSGFSRSGEARSGSSTSGGSSTKNTTLENTTGLELEDHKNTHSLSPGHVPTAAATSSSVPQQREREAQFANREQYPNFAHRALARLGYAHPNWRNYIINKLVEREGIWSDGWWVTAAGNGTLEDAAAEIRDEWLAANGKRE